MPYLRRLPLVLAIGAYAVLAECTVREVGLVGEVEQSWRAGRPAAVLVDTEPPRWADGAAASTAGHRLGPFVASQARPVERLDAGGLALPIAVNLYTGGLPDWPARLAVAATGLRAGGALVNLALGAGVLFLVHRFLRAAASDLAAGAAVLFLATDWSFVFYRKVLGGTETALQAATILCLSALWSRRWTGGRRAPLLFALGAGLGLHAKATFALVLGALVLTAVLTRWDRPDMRPPPRPGPWAPLLVAALLLAPLAIAWVHHGIAVPGDPHVRSHDFVGVQLDRLRFAALGVSPTREGLGNLWFAAADPLAFFERAYGATGAPGPSPWRLVGWGVVAAGAVLAWTDRHPTPHLALLRFSSLFLAIQVALLLLVARDLHHLALAAPTLAVVAGLALERLAAVAAPPRSFARLRWAVVLAAPWLLAGPIALVQTDSAIASIPVPTFTERGQRAIVEMVRGAGVLRLVACSYELTGVLEGRAPEVAVVHGWGAASRERGGALPGLLSLAEGGHFLVVRASAPMIYDLAPEEGGLRAAAGGREVARVAEIDGATLYAVGAAQSGR